MPAFTTTAATRRFDFVPVLIVLFCLIWSSAFAAAKIAVHDSPPLLLLGSRFLLAGLLMLGFCAVAGHLKGLAPRDVVLLSLFGILNNACYLGLSYLGLRTVSSGFTAVIVSANPLLTALVAAPLLGERMTWRKLAGLLLGMAGVAIVLRSRLGDGHEDLGGTLLIIAALITLTAATLLYKRMRTSGSLVAGSAIQCLAGGLVLLPLGLVFEDVSAVRFTPWLVGSFAYLTLAGSVGAFSIWMFILSRTTATRASALHFLMPPLGLMFGWLLLREPVPLLDLVGIVPIALGLWMVTR